MRYLVFTLFFLLSPLGQAQTLPLKKLTLPPGFHIEVFAQVPNARQMVLGPGNTLFVGSKELGNVYAVTYRNSKVKVYKIASHLETPAGVDYYQGSLYVAALDRIMRFDHIEKHLNKPPKPVIITNTLPNDTYHGWRFLRFGPDKKLYFGIGAPCNTCIREDKRFATISRMNADGSQFEIFAKGVRNSVGFDWDPITNYMWFTDNGRDLLGDNLPPDEINLAKKAYQHFGFPHCYGKDTLDATYGKKDCKNFTEAAYELPAHVASIGMRFYTGKQFPAEYRQQIFIAEHGSWNRSHKIGYQVVLATLSSDRKKIINVKPFISGWLQPNEKVWGRPADILVMRDGSILISDDFAGVIYRVYYSNEKQT